MLFPVGCMCAGLLFNFSCKHSHRHNAKRSKSKRNKTHEFVTQFDTQLIYIKRAKPGDNNLLKKGE